MLSDERIKEIILEHCYTAGPTITRMVRAAIAESHIAEWDTFQALIEHHKLHHQHNSPWLSWYGPNTTERIEA